MKKILLTALLVMAVSSLTMAQRVLITKGDQYAGAKLALGSVAGSSWGLVGTYEMGLQENIGVGGSIGYSGYSEDFNAGFFAGKWSYTNILILGTGSYHMDLLKDENLDTWGSLHVGYNVATVSWEFTNNAFNLAEPAAASAGGFVVGLSANARYKLAEQWYLSGSVGFGLGIVNIGVDYKL